MARPMSATDEDILTAAHAVMARRGSDGFTVSEVAREIGLSRAAIIQRFKGVEHLRGILLDQLAHSFENHLAQLCAEPGAPGLVEIADLVGTLAGERRKFTAFLLDYNANIADRERLAMEEQRGLAMRAAVARVMPPLSVEKSVAVDAFMAHLTGSLMAWQSMDHPDAASFLIERTMNWLQLVGISRPAGEGTSNSAAA